MDRGHSTALDTGSSRSAKTSRVTTNWFNATSTLGSNIRVLAVTILCFIALSWLQRGAVNDARSTQANIDQISVLTREINNLTWIALREGSLSPKADDEMREARGLAIAVGPLTSPAMTQPYHS